MHDNRASSRPMEYVCYSHNSQTEESSTSKHSPYAYESHPVCIFQTGATDVALQTLKTHLECLNTYKDGNG